MQNTLHNQHLLITRPQPGAQRLAAQCQQQGATVTVFPTIVIAPCERNDDMHTALQAFHQADSIIFTSPNAVHYCLEACQAYAVAAPTHARIFAVGESTAQMLIQHWHCSVDYPRASFNSEALLALPALQTVSEQRMTIVTGVGGRDVLQETLTQRGAIVNKVAVYQRLCPDQRLDPHSLAAIDVIIATSVEGLHNLMQLIHEPDRTTLLQKKLLVISPRMHAAAIALGFSAHLIITAHSAQDCDIISMLLAE